MVTRDRSRPTSAEQRLKQLGIRYVAQFLTLEDLRPDTNLREQQRSKASELLENERSELERIGS